MVRAWCRLVAALLGFSAVVTELAVLAERGTLVPANFFSYFTVETNLVAVVALLAAATSPRGSRGADLLRGAATTYLVVVLVAFSVLLAGLDADLTAVPWDNVVLHYLMPLVLVVDWVLDPPRRPIPLRTGLAWLAFPLVYLVYSLVRGVVVGWYPYPFLDPARGGYGRVALVGLGIAVLGVVAAWLVIRLPWGRDTPKRR